MTDTTNSKSLYFGVDQGSIPGYEHVAPLTFDQIVAGVRDQLNFGGVPVADSVEACLVDKSPTVTKAVVVKVTIEIAHTLGDE
jgi:hypothetical protein